MNDALFARQWLPSVQWYAGSRPRFALATSTTSADLHLFDHVGLARLQAINPLRAGKLAIMIHSVEMWRVDRSDYRQTARKADLLIANSEYTARRTLDCVANLPSIRVCWPGRDMPEAVASSEAEPAPGIGPQAMLIVGRLDGQQRHKGHDHLLEALPFVSQAVPDAQLVIVGDGDDRARLEAKARELGLTKQVIFAGHLKEGELHALYERCALFVMPSDGDGFGLVFLEAMMHRLPCVGLQTGAAAEIFEDGVSGVLVDREDIPTMASRLADLLLDESERKKLGEAGFERYRSHFTGRHYRQRLQSILMEQLGR